MPSIWLDALKKFNEGRNSWMMPRKDSPEHAQVVKIMNKMKASAPAPAPAPAPAKAAKVPKDSELPTKKKESVAPAPAPKKAPKKVKMAEEVDTTPEEDTVNHLAAYKKTVPKPTEKKAKVAKAAPKKKRAPKKVVVEAPESDAESAESE